MHVVDERFFKEAEKEKEVVEEEDLLSDDIRQLMEELETESADIQAAKIQPQEALAAQVSLATTYPSPSFPMASGWNPYLSRQA